MERADRATLRALGFKDAELKALDLWDVADDDPANLAEAYLRRSKKKDTLSTLREHLRELCRKAKDERKQIRHVWFEQRSASKAYVRREEFENATAAIIEEGKSKTLYAWRTDRLSRRGMGAVDRLIDQMEPKGARIVITSEGLDSSLPGMRMVFGILADRAREEAKSISLRTKIGGDAHKKEGKWPGGVPPFGLEVVDGKLCHKESEYSFARNYIAVPLLHGVVPGDIANALNALSIRTRKGKLWRAQTVIALAQTPSWAGLIPDRERATDESGAAIDKWYKKGQPLMGADGHPIKCGVGVVTFAEWKQINAKIESRSRPGTAIGDRTRGVRQAKTLVTNILKCPRCKGAAGNGGANYRCAARTNQGPSVCLGFATARGRLDRAMASMWLNHIMSLSPESPTIHQIARDWLSYENPDKEARRQAVTAALDSALSRQLKLNKEFFLGTSANMDEATFEDLRERVAKQIKDLKAELNELGKAADLTPLMNPKALAALWEIAGIEGQRALLKAAVKEIHITPAKGVGDRTPIEKRLKPAWKDQHDARDVDGALKAVERSTDRRKARKMFVQTALTA
ncbi:recombinase family protein [Streptomyces sp. NBC_01207]|uniref:recombinase family protein n=1 Tax=Streptomyces sp. NBC_01207 TaxID=2903772 RepID=UPI002E0F12E6|nr:recombinase family protein [Streptomyces sp. NBC_01207]